MPPLQPVSVPLQEIIAESLNEAGFLWRRWESELTSLTRSLDEVWSWTEDRLHGALDGVRVAGPGAIEIATEALQSDDVDLAVVGASVLASSSETGASEVLIAILEAATAPKLDAILRALELLGTRQVLRAAATVLAKGKPEFAGTLCRLKTFRRSAPGDEMTAAFASTLPTAKLQAIRAAGYASSPIAEELLLEALRSADIHITSAAVESGLCLGLDEAWSTARRLARQLDGPAAAYLRLLALFGASDDHEVIYSALAVPQLQTSAIWALGHLGTVRATEACIAGMRHQELARAAGEAYCWITGADLERDHLAIVEAPPDAPAFEDDDLEANLVPEPQQLWPLPDPDAVGRHWLALRSEFAADVRHIGGLPMSGSTLLAQIERGPMLRRPDLVFELRVRTRGKYDVETRAFSQRQRQMMATGRAAIASTGGG